MDSTISDIRKSFDKAIALPISKFYTPQYNNIRRLKIIALSHMLSQSPEFKKTLSSDEQLDIVIRMENSCSNETIRKSREYNLRCSWDNDQFIDTYHSICYNILAALNSDLELVMTKILSKELDINNIANLKCNELLPEKYDRLMHKVNKRINVEQIVKYTEMHFCKTCKKNQTTVERIQNRSGDEGSSFHITCVFCNTKWFK